MSPESSRTAHGGLDFTDPGGCGVNCPRYLASVVEFSGDGILSNTVEGVIRTWNRGAERVFGYTAEEIVGQSISKLAPPDRLGEERAILGRIIEGRGPQQYETVRVRKDRSTIHVSIVVSPILDGTGRLIGASKVVRDITAQKQAELELLESEERLRLISLATNDAVWEWDPRSNLLRWNPRFGAMFNSTEMESVVGIDAWTARIHPDDRERVLARLAEFTASAETQWVNEYRFQCAEGRYADVLDRGFALRAPDGRPVRMLGAMVDLTAQKAVERHITESQQFLQATLNSLSAHIAILDEKGVVIATNESWLRFAVENGGSARTCGVGASYLEVCDAAGRLGAPEGAAMSEGVRRVLKNECSLFTQEYPCPSPTEERWFVARVTPFVGSGTARAVVAHEDITARRKAEDALRASEERYELSVRGSGAGLWDCDMRTGRIYASPRCWEILGLPQPSQLTVGMPFFLRSVHPDDVARVRAAIGAHLRRREPYDLEYRLRAAAGGYAWVRACGQALWNAEGKPYRMAGSLVDITAQKQAEAEKNALETRLRQSQKMEAVGTLAGGIAHDFNNILGSIIGYTELALRAAQPPQVRADLSEVLHSSQRARDLVKQILAFSRQQQPARKGVVLQRVVENALRIVRASIPVTIEITTRMVATPVVMHADETQLAQVLLNLTSNAAQAIGARPGRILVEMEQLEPAHPDTRDLEPAFHDLPLARLRISDTGPGIAPGILERVFDPFFTTKEPGEGTGLGLSVVHGIVRAHHGAIRASNTAPSGAVFSVYLPIQSSDVPPRSSAGEPPLGHGERILVADGDAAAANALCRQLERLGYRVTLADSGMQALRRFTASDHTFRLLITRLALPGASGPELAVAVWAAKPALPVMILAGKDERMPPDTPADAGCLFVHPAAMGLDALAEAVRHALEDSRPSTRL